MNQTTWIVGGGIIIIAIAAVLFMYTGDGVPTSKEKPNADVETPVVATTTASTTKDTFATATPPVTTTQTTKPKMEPTTNNNTATVIMHTTMGDVTLSLYTKDAPKTVENFLKLSRDGFYNGVRFHRVIEGFMIQGGDPLSKDDAQKARWGTGGPGYKFPDEINASSALYQKGYKRGVLAMANSGPNTNGSQFFIMHKDYQLPPLYVIFGQVTSGLDVVDKIATTQTDANDQPLTAVTVTSIEVK